MYIKTSKLSKNEAEILFELSWDEFLPHIERANEEISKDLKVPGFRPGKIPLEIVKKTIGQEKLLFNAANLAITKEYQSFLKDQSNSKKEEESGTSLNFEADFDVFDIIGQPKVEIMKLAHQNPFCFKIKVEILPKVKLADYKVIAAQIPKKQILATDEEVEQALEQFKKSEIEFERLKSKFPNTEELKKNIREGIQKEKENFEIQTRRLEIIDKIAERSNLDIPENLILNEKRRAIEGLKKYVREILKIEFERYLEDIKKTEKELEEIYQQQAKKTIQRFLILREIGKKEKIEIKEEEINILIQEHKKLFPSQKLDVDNLKEYYRDVLFQDKIFEKLF